MRTSRKYNPAGWTWGGDHVWLSIYPARWRLGINVEGGAVRILLGPFVFNRI